MLSRYRKPFSPQPVKDHEDDQIHDNDDISHVFRLGKYREINEQSSSSFKKIY